MIAPRRGLRGRRPRAGGADQAGARADRPGRRAAGGSNNWAVSGERSATGGPLIAGDPHLPSGMPGHLAPVRARAGRPLLPRRHAAGHPRDHDGPEQRRRLDLHQRHGGHRGPVHRADRGRPLRVPGRVARRWSSSRRRSTSRAATSRCAIEVRDHPPRPDRQRGARRRRRAAAGAALGGAGRAGHRSPPTSRSSTRPAARSWWSCWRA